MTEVNFKKEVQGSLESIIAEVTDRLKEQGFGVLNRIDLHSKIEEKIGKHIRPTVILGACNPQLAYEAYLANPDVASLLPCNAVVREIDSGRFSIELAKPTALMRILGDDRLIALSQQADDRLRAALASIKFHSSVEAGL